MNDDNENTPEGDDIKPIQFIIGGGNNSTKDHSDCHQDSPCQRPEEFRSLGKSMGIRGMTAEGEIWLNRQDVLALLAETYEAYHAVTHEMKERAQNGDEEAASMAFSTFVSAQTVNLIGGQLHRMTEMDNAIDLSIPDTIPNDWLSDTPTGAPAPESPIETAIRKAKEAALEAQAAKEEGK